MALLTNKQAVGAVFLAGLAGWWLYRQSQALITATSDAVSDSAWWYGYQLEKASDAIESLSFDEFDKKHRHRNKLMNDAQYERWRAAVMSGKLPEPEYKD